MKRYYRGPDQTRIRVPYGLRRRYGEHVTSAFYGPQLRLAIFITRSHVCLT
jgi:hypothetical protein